VIAKLTITELHKDLLKVVAYFDVFNYPLKKEEIISNSSLSIAQNKYEGLLEDLVEEKYLKRVEEFYLLFSSSESIIDKRLAGNEAAAKMMVTAYKYSKIVSTFPFVAGVCISGGLSKNYYDEKSDIDFFIITKANRLWLCRSLFIVFYKLLPQTKRKYYCLNYFISEKDLTIEDKNRFVAVELAYLIPTVNYKLYSQLIADNSWYKQWYPNKNEFANENCIELPFSAKKSLIESLFPGKFGNWLDDQLMNFTSKQWRKKFNHVNEIDFNIQFRSRKNVCKRHTSGNQNKVLQLLDRRLTDMQIE